MLSSLLVSAPLVNLSPLIPFTWPAFCKLLARTSAVSAHAVSPTAPPSSASREQVHATINGRPVHVPEGTSILDAARKLKIHVPTLCTHPRLLALGSKPPGTCRLCLVDTGGGRLQPACATPLCNGTQVQTDTPAVLDNIHSVLSLLRANHPNDCMTCESNGHCEFQDLLLRYKVGDWLPKLREYSQVCFVHRLINQSTPNKTGVGRRSATRVRPATRHEYCSTGRRPRQVHQVRSLCDRLSIGAGGVCAGHDGTWALASSWLDGRAA